MKVKPTVILAIIILFIFCGCAQEPISVTSNQLYSEYFEHELNADAQFKGKTLLVTGEIADFGRNNINIAYVMLWATYEKTLEEKPSEEKGKEDDSTSLSVPGPVTVVLPSWLTSGGIECWFPTKYEKDLTDIKTNDSITIRGTCKGLARGILGNSGNIILENCSILKP